MIKGYPHAVLTPNAIEFSRLVHSVLNWNDVGPSTNPDPLLVGEVARQLGGLTIVHKGSIDIISNGSHTEFCKEDGSPRR